MEAEGGAVDREAVVPRLTNAEIAAALDEVAGLLAAQGAGEFRVRAWRRGAETVRTHPRPVAVQHTTREGWTFHALFSNTALAHRLGRTRDWVVIYFERNGDEGQVTVVTERQGPLRGRRVVRGHEGQCIAFYRKRSA